MSRVGYAAVAVAAVVVGAVALATLGPRFGVGSGSSPGPSPSVELGIFEPVAGWTIYGDHRGVWGIAPSAPAGAAATRIQLAPEPFTPLGWWRDCTKLLIKRGIDTVERLFLLHADGSETPLTEQPMQIRVATFSPDWSRVVFVSTRGVASVGANPSLYTVDIGGGPIETKPLFDDDVNAEAMAFSPDRTRIAIVVGSGDWGHHVWLMDSDGGDAQEIVANGTTLGPGHVRDPGLEWSPSGDRIAINLAHRIYTFRPDGSGFTEEDPDWSAARGRLGFGCAV